ncbi:ArgK/MeaB family GTPase [Achromobacter xylosoxidans]|uniref:ArgK/MeaB family GTPase n=1 Tax=Alcaligenes xylosoxydans xylosoxydans TaxID=85698 RepID=UPI000B49059A|nr:GTP-binding protein [Achromobacter xylosoxidans]
MSAPGLSKREDRPVSAPPLDRWALSRALTRMANADAAEVARFALRDATAHAARRIGITGAPGAGKSTLVGHLALERAPTGRLGVLAVDPSSPKSGGAILGDRVRMDDLAGIGDLYIRSLGSRRTCDGLADNLPEMLDIMDEFGFDEVLLETVGIGQAEYAARAQVDTLVLVLLPESGDVVQAMKAGIMEMADIYVVNKSDLPGAKKMATDIQRIAAVSPRPEGAWRAPVLLASSTQPDSIRALSQAIDRHQAWRATDPERRQRLRAQRLRYRLRRMLEMRIAHAIAHADEALFDAPLRQQMDRILATAGNTLDF